MSDNIVVGIDIAKLKFDVAVWSGKNHYKTKHFSNDLQGFDAFTDWLKPDSNCHFCMEATGTYGYPLALYLSDKGWIISVVNPVQIHAFGKAESLRHKTDKIDAKLIARYCASHHPPVWQPAPHCECQLLALVRHLNKLKEMLLTEENRLSVADEIVCDSHTKIITLLKQEINDTEQKIKKHIDDFPMLKKNKALLESIPGIGERLSTTLLAYIGDGSRFHHSGQVVAYAGLNPKLHESGQLKGRAHLSKQGSAELRKALYMPALAAINCNKVVKKQWEQLTARYKGDRAIASKIH
ncbi:IS110 family transposase [Xenorhabdus sp. Vera]|uniref:IS110 family transposase n=1 Tax=Xenorhabdus koppenhoeferi TaxID=351659 RepID=UPI0019C4DE20|nr:IS110 family transposase [Xenorhabdus sp. Vera]MBD2809867.1 IS110 family transposase [Xenorhabdus sp. Vera]